MPEHQRGSLEIPQEGEIIFLTAEADVEGLRVLEGFTMIVDRKGIAWLSWDGQPEPLQIERVQVVAIHEPPEPRGLEQ